jgi:hypothetical protein
VVHVPVLLVIGVIPTDQLQTVQYAFARDFPNLATQYGTSNTTVEDINVGYYAAA